MQDKISAIFTRTGLNTVNTPGGKHGILQMPGSYYGVWVFLTDPSHHSQKTTSIELILERLIPGCQLP